MLWDPFLYCINDSIQGNSETGNKVFVLPSKVAINTETRKHIYYIAEKAEQYIEEYKKHISGENTLDKREFRRKYGWSTLKYFHKELEIG